MRHTFIPGAWCQVFTSRLTGSLHVLTWGNCFRACMISLATQRTHTRACRDGCEAKLLYWLLLDALSARWPFGLHAGREQGLYNLQSALLFLPPFPVYGFAAGERCKAT